MALNAQQKHKLKAVLFEQANETEKKEISALEASALQARFEELKKTLDALSDADSKAVGKVGEHFAEIVRKMKSDIKSIVSEINKFSDSLKETHSESTKELLKGFGEMREILKGADINKNAGPLYKTMINHLAGMETAFKNWKYPQYASVSVRDKSFANIDPSTEDKAGKVTDGTTTVVTAGTAIQITSTPTPCYAVYIQCHEGNTGAIAVGASTVKAALSGRRGLILYPTNFQKFTVNDVSLLWIDAVNSGDKAHWYVEKSA